ncbi:calmodulin-A-like [Actinia tenebrosa]|uniref:Calmodulin-A-like n=1 Tax=Actinia tenebrosa TaxID=6105 RepID=A0A6P8IK73_ACTTE|nr:calmodulin-A-like [Actinia tenebrosa]
MATSIEADSPKDGLETEEPNNKMRKAFQRADSDLKGRIPCVQFSTAAQAAGLDPTEDELDELFQHFDKTDESGINFDEFVDMMSYLEEGSEKDYEETLRKAFKKFDRDGSGYISPEELRYVVCNTGEKFSQSEAEELIDMFDVNKDGQLSWEEFVTFIKTSMLELEDNGQDDSQDDTKHEDAEESNAVLENHK